MWLTGKRTLFTLYSVLGIQLHCTVFVSWLFCTLWWLHTMCLYHVCACTVDYVHRLCIVHVLYCLSWLQTVYCALPVFIVNVHEHCLHWLCCTLWNAHCEMHTVKCTLWNAYCEMHTVKCTLCAQLRHRFLHFPHFHPLWPHSVTWQTSTPNNTLFLCAYPLACCVSAVCTTHHHPASHFQLPHCAHHPVCFHSR